MLSKVREHVDERRSHLARRRERATEPAVRPKASFSPDELVHGSRNANCDAAHTGGQSSLVARFGYQVNVIPLHGKVEDTKTLGIAPRSAPDGETNRRENVLAPQRSKVRPQRYVHRVPGCVIRTCAVRSRAPYRVRLAPGTDAGATPTHWKREWQLSWPATAPSIHLLARHARWNFS